MRAVHYFLEGDWSPEHDVEDSALEEGLRGGRLFDLAAYLGLASEKCLRQGRFEEARAKIEMLGKIRELYEYEPAKLAFYGQLLILHLEERRLSETQHDGDVYKEASPQDLLHLLSYGLKAKAQLLAGEREAAEESLSRAAEALRKAGRPLPYHLGAFLASRLHADLRDLEDAAGRVEGVPRTLRKRSRRSARAALRVVPTVAFWGPEIFRSVGRQAWLCGQTKEALRWWERSLAAGRRLGTRPELARTAQELSLRLAEGRRGARELEGRGTASWRDEARSVFTELGLAWDLERLEGDSPP
jgi:tetratricopeptide (TPR) repeat protein